MDNLKYVLWGMALGLVVFSVLNFFQVWRHLRRNRRSSDPRTSIADMKYMELKTRQDFIISAGSVLLGLIAFIGIGTINDFKSELRTTLAKEVGDIEKKTDSLKEKLAGLTLQGDDVGAVYTNTAEGFKKLQSDFKKLSTKDIVSQDIYIVESIRLRDHPLDKAAGGNFTVRFDKLQTVSGKPLPKFNKPPAIMCLSPNGALPQIQKVTSEAIILNVRFSAGSAGNEDDEWGSATMLTLWVMERY